MMMDIINLILNWLRSAPAQQMSNVAIVKMKKVKIERNDISDKAIRGQLTIENICHDPIYTLENPKRDTNIDSCIPAGKYKCIPHNSTKYPDTYEILDVPERTAILLHWGNTEKDTLGCIILGEKLGNLNGEPAVLGSKVCYERFRELIGKESFDLEIID